MAVYQTPESKKEEYRRYLEKSGVIDALTKGTVGARSTFCAALSPPPQTIVCDSSVPRLLLLPFFLKVLVGLYEETDRPPNALDFVRKYVGVPAGVDVDALRAENTEMRRQVEELQRTVDQLNRRLEAAGAAVEGSGGGSKTGKTAAAVVPSAAAPGGAAP